MEYGRKNVDRLDELMSTIQKTDNIPTLPKIISKITDLMDDDTFSVKYIGELMTKDLSLSARILKIVNSPFYGFSQRIYNLNHAIVLLGANVLKSIVISTSVFTAMKESMEGLWEHSLFCAFTAKCVARTLNKDKKRLISNGNKKKYMIDEDLVFSAALLHDIGKVIIATTFKNDFKNIIETAKHNNIPLIDIEYKNFNTSHDYLGYVLIKEWHLPPSIYFPIKYHHNLVLADEFKIETAIINLADFLTKSIGIGFSGSPYIEKLNGEVIKILGIDIDFIRNIIEEIYSFKEELYIFD